MENFNYQELFSLIQQESDLLKIYATQEEIGKLDVRTLENTRTKCVYGQMTGSCDSKRAIELIQKCCSRVYTVTTKPQINGSPLEEKRNDELGALKYFSPIETLICITSMKSPGPFGFLVDSQNIKDLIAYLKGEKEQLTLSVEGMGV